MQNHYLQCLYIQKDESIEGFGFGARRSDIEQRNKKHRFKKNLKNVSYLYQVN